MPVHPPEHQPLPVEEHYPILEFKPAEADGIGNDLRHLPAGAQCQGYMVKAGGIVAPGPDARKREFRAYMVFAVKGQRHLLVHEALDGAVDACVFRFPAE